MIAILVYLFLLIAAADFGWRGVLHVLHSTRDDKIADDGLPFEDGDSW
jgi:hypothetical protein